MTDIYDTLCVVRTALLNSIAEHLIAANRVPNYVEVLESVAEEVGRQYDNIIVDLQELSIDDLEDLGFRFLSDESDMMLFPLWLYPFIPDEAMLHTVDDDIWVKSDSPAVAYADHWLNVGFFYA